MHIVAHRQAISIHALREEGDVSVMSAAVTTEISIHALCEEGDPRPSRAPCAVGSISIHALREEGD